MASLTPLTTTTHPKSNTRGDPLILEKPFLAKPSQLSLYQNRARSVARTKLVTCEATNNNEPKNTNNTSRFDRRNMLIGLGGIYGAAATLGLGGSSMAVEVSPDLNRCQPKTDNLVQPPGKKDEDCCLKFDPKKVKDFRFQDYDFRTMKIRREAHWASANDPTYVDAYKKAVATMKALPANHPHSWEMQRLIHCAYCDGSYFKNGTTGTRMKVHFNWLFAPFHRWYLFCFERIKAKYSGRADMGLPYWSWDNPKSMTIPPMYFQGVLDHDKRNKDHINRVVDLDFLTKYSKADRDNHSADELINQNLDIMRKRMNVKNRAEFFGGEFSVVTELKDDKKGGKLEVALHNGVHAWVEGDMGYYSTSGRDPLFYAHHANVDLMWSIWKTLWEGRADLGHPDYLNAKFVLSDENGDAVRVKVEDCLNTKNLGYTYECNYLPWRDDFPKDCEDVGGWGGGGVGYIYKSETQR